jgi:glycosyltransferase involved in cell wall biosynthesis
MGCGGAERRFAWLMNGLTRRGHDIALRVLHGRQSFFELRPTVGVRFFEKDCSVGSASAGRFLLRPRWIREQIIAGSPDVVLSFIDVANAIALWAARPLDVPVVVCERTHPPSHSVPLHYRILRRWLYPSAARVVVQTQATAEWARSWLDAEIVATIPNPVVAPPTSDDGFDPESLADGRPLMIAMGRLEKEKGFDRLLKAFALIAQRHPEWSLVILGEGSERRSLEKTVAGSGLDGRVLLPGFSTSPEKWLRASRLFVLSSHYEGFPNALGEAMACGLPVISFDCPVGPRELVVDKENGLLVPSGDVDALADAITSLVSQPEKARAMGNRARSVVERFSEPAIMSQWEGLLAELQSSGRVRENQGSE